MSFRLLRAAFLLLLTLGTAAAAPPANDDYASAPDLGSALPVTIAGTMVEATMEPGESNVPLTVSDGAIHSSVWYRWTAPADGWVGGTLPAGVSLTAFHDGPGVPDRSRAIRNIGEYYANPWLPVRVTTGQVLTFQVATRYGSVAGPFSFVLNTVPPPNDGPVWGGYADLPRAPSVAVTSTNIGATVAPEEVLPPGAAVGSTVYFLLEAYGAFPCEISTAGSAMDTVLAVYTNGQTALLAWNDDAAPGDRTSRVTFTPTASSAWYIIQVGGYSGEQGEFQLRVNYTLPPAPANDARAGATDLGSSSNVSLFAQTHAASSEPGEVLPGGLRRTLWYRWTAPAAGAYKVDGTYALGNESPVFCVYRDVPGLPGVSDLVEQGLPAVFRAAAGQTFLISAGGRLGYAGYEYAGTVTLLPQTPLAQDDFTLAPPGPLRNSAGGAGDGWLTPWVYDSANLSTANPLPASSDGMAWSAVSAAGSLGHAAGRRAVAPAVSGTVSLYREIFPDAGQDNTVRYFSALIRTDSTAAGAFAGLRLRTNNGPVIFFGKPAAGATGKWVIEDTGGAGQESFQSWPIVPGRTARLVVRASFGAVDEFKFYTDVAPDAPEYTYNPSIKTGSYGLIRGLGLFSNAACEIDDLRMGPTWESVTMPEEEAPVIFNEAFTGAAYDFNLDGIASATEDSYCELVNRSALPQDLSGQSVWYGNSSLRHTFPPGTVLQPGQSLVIFGGGQVAEGVTAAFGYAWVQRANGPPVTPGGRLDLRSTTDTGAAVLASFSDFHYWFPTTRWPELTGNAFTAVRHHDTRFVPGGHAGSPGQRVNLTPFLPLTQALTASISRGSVVEGAGWNAAALTVSRSGSLTEPLTVQIRSSHPALVNSSPDHVVMPASESAITVPLGFYADSTENPNQTVTLTAIGSGYLNGTASVTVLESDRRIFINEINAQSSGGGGGGDFGEFIELYDGGLGNKPLHDFIVVLFDADAVNDGAYRVIDLQGRMTNSHGFLLIDSTTFPELTPGWLTNGSGAVAIYKKRQGDGMGGGGGGGPASAPFFDYPPGTPPAANTWLVDAVTHVTDDAPDLALVALFTPGGAQADEGPAPGPGIPNMSTARCPDARAPFDSGAFRRLMPTPGTWNLTYPGFGTWGTPRGVISETDDNDSDGLDNLMEYALGGIPLSLGGEDTSSASLLPAPLDNPFGELRMLVRKGPEAGYDPRLEWLVEHSTDLIHWTTRDVVIVQEDCATLTAAYVGSTPRVQLRLRVVQRP